MLNDLDLKLINAKIINLFLFFGQPKIITLKTGACDPAWVNNLDSFFAFCFWTRTSWPAWVLSIRTNTLLDSHPKKKK